jgi:hypothetical protein
MAFEDSVVTSNFGILDICSSEKMGHRDTMNQEYFSRLCHVWNMVLVKSWTT